MTVAGVLLIIKLAQYHLVWCQMPSGPVTVNKCWRRHPLQGGHSALVFAFCYYNQVRRVDSVSKNFPCCCAVAFRRVGVRSSVLALQGFLKHFRTNVEKMINFLWYTKLGKENWGWGGRRGRLFFNAAQYYCFFFNKSNFFFKYSPSREARDEPTSLILCKYVITVMHTTYRQYFFVCL